MVLMVNALLSPDLTVSRLCDIDVVALLEKGIRALLLDLDNTIVPYNTTSIAPENEAWLKSAQQLGMQLCLVSNAEHDRLHRTVGHLNLPFVGQARKPSRAGFRKGMKIVNTAPHETAIVGDQIFTDVLGGRRSGLYTIFISHQRSREQWWMRPVRRLERAVLSRKIPTL